MALETTLVLVKPDGVQRGLAGTILARFEARGFQVVGLKLVVPPKALLEQHYGAHKDKPFYPGLVAFMGSGPVVALALRGLKAIDVVRKMMGKTNSAEAAPGTIRGDLGLSRSFNLIHGSDSAESAAKELALWFKPGEILSYDLVRLQQVIDLREEG
ncbi:MAG: nucleoside-diphosphate kinase [Planctomycetia bacterium]